MVEMTRGYALLLNGFFTCLLFLLFGVTDSAAAGSAAVSQESEPMMRMYSASRAISVELGRELMELSCDFHSEIFNLFDNPVQWHKTQINETVPVNMMGNLLEPFASSLRFRVALIQTHPKYNLQLTVSDIQACDSGNYTCQISGPNNSLLASVTYDVTVKLGVQRVVMTTNTTNNMTIILHDESVKVMKVVENQPTNIRCIAIGGYPSMDVAVYLNDTDITRRFRFRRRHLETWFDDDQDCGSLGLRRVISVIEMATNEFRVDHTYDKTSVRCVAIATETLRPVATEVALEVQYLPVIECTQSTVCMTNNTHVRMSCKVMGRPWITSLYWLHSSWAISASNVDYWTTVTMLADDQFHLETSLSVTRINPEVDQFFFVVAGNGRGRRSRRLNFIANGCLKNTTSVIGRASETISGCCNQWQLVLTYFLTLNVLQQQHL